ncbi:MAG: aldo/keto reductase [Chitinophagales bacterium]
MKYNKLGRTGLDCSKIGFGTWQIGGGRWKGITDSKALKLLNTAKDFGINIFDIALVYGQYRGENHDLNSRSLEFISKAFKGKARSEIIINLKVGQVDEYSHRSNYSPKNIVTQVDKALKKLGTDYIDICLIHAPSLKEIEDEIALTILKTLQACGKIRFLGYSIEAEPNHAELILNQKIDILMLQYNLIDRECANIFPIAERKGIGILTGGPFKRGYLTGKFDSIKDLPLKDNYWQWNINYSKDKVAQILEKAKGLKEKYGNEINLRKEALNFVAENKAVGSIVVGFREENEIVENINLLNLE